MNVEQTIRLDMNTLKEMLAERGIEVGSATLSLKIRRKKGEQGLVISWTPGKRPTTKARSK